MNRIVLAVLIAARLSTWTIVAVDPKTGDVGVAGATCLPSTYADAIAALVPGKGAAAVQAFWDLDNRNKVVALLREGKSADEILHEVTNPSFDSGFNDRQYGVITMSRGTAKVAAFTGKETFAWSGSEQDISRAVTVQGNILV